jgi:hypothetical protein
MRPRVKLAAMAAVVAVVFAGAVARAQTPAASCDLFEIEASNDGEGVDKGLSSLSKVLKKAPFSSWKAFKLLKKHQKPVKVEETVTVSLDAGGTLDLTVKEIVRKQGKKARLRIGVKWMNAKQKKTEASSEVDSGDAWLIGGEPLEKKPKSTYFLGIACAAK